MKILQSWLKDYIDVKKSDDELADILTFSGTLVEDIEKGLDSSVIVASILNIEKHPNADRLRVATVDTGSEKLQIVCGASNIEEGLIVPLATVGSKLSGMEIKEAEIRGVKSFGMLCSEKELGISQNHEGIMILGENYKLGEPLNKYLGSDAVFDLEITPNRGDCLSHLGIARELSAILKTSLNFTPERIEEIPDNFNIEILSPELCYQYHGAIIEGVKIASSPEWLKERLEKVGIKPINNIVDITNYIMFDLGQPLHAFDRKKITDDTIIVRNAKSDETIVSIDGQKRNLDEHMLVIADKNGPIAIAGVMGGQNSEIDDNTTAIILESAEFDRKSVRKTSKDLGLTTEASYRFERGIDPELSEVAMNKAARMIVEICGGKIIAKRDQIASNNKNAWIKIEYEKINNILGTDIDKDGMDDILKRLGFFFREGMCQAPSWRHDIAILPDLAEEIGRIYGFANIPLKPLTEKKIEEKSNYHKKEFLKDILVGLGFVEVYSYPFLSEADIKITGINNVDLLEIANPIQPENKYLRKTLIPGLLKSIAKNPSFDPVLIFEIGNTFTKETEETHLALAASGKQAEKTMKETLSKFCGEIETDTDLFQVKALSRDELGKYKIKKPITVISEIKIDQLLKNIKIPDNFELTISKKQIHYRPISKFPSIVLDVAFIVDKETAKEGIIDLIYEQSSLINRVELFDEFASDKFGSNKKNIAFHLDLQDLNKTLTDKEADSVMQKVIKAVEDKFEAKLRNY